MFASKRGAFVAAILSGILCGLSQPIVLAFVSPEPLDASGWSGLLAFVGLVPVFISVASASPRRAFLLGWCASSVQIVVIAHWVYFALGTFAGIAGPIAIMLTLVAGLTLGAVLGLGYLAFAWLRPRLRWPAPVLFAACLTTAELARNHIPFGGDPWGNLGMSLATIAPLRQGASIVGVYGLVFLVVLINCVIATALTQWRSGQPLAKSPLVATVAIVAVWLGFGLFRLADAPGEEPPVKVGILQASIDQRVINDPQTPPDTINQRHRALQADALSRGAEIVVWPEAALAPGVPRDASSLLDTGFARGSTGSTRAAERPRADALPAAAVVGTLSFFDAQPGLAGLYNSAFFVGSNAKVVGRVDKVHLLPFGEYAPWPLDHLLEALVTVPAKLFAGTEDDPVILPVGERRIRVGATICYEGVFPEISRSYAARGARLMFNLTNDAWYGVSSAAHQHVLMYSMRATETARPVVRAANSGISAVIDHRGRITARTQMNESVALVASVQPRDERTLYSYVGEWVAVSSLLLLVFGAFSAWRTRKSG